MTELSKGEIVATLMGRELSKRLARAHKRITEAQSRTASELSAIRAVEDSHARSIDAVRESVGGLSAADASLTRTAEEQRALLGLTTDAMAEIDARLRANEATDQAQDTQLGLLDLRVAEVEALAPVPGPKGDKGDKGDAGPPGRPGRSSVGGGVGQATTILSGGTAVGTRGTLNFVSGATVTDDPANERVNITVSGGGGNVNSVSVSSGLSITGVSDLTITNTGVRSLAGSGISVSASTGAVTITAPVVAGGTGISVSGSQTTSLSIGNTGVTSIVAGTNVSVSGATGAVTVNAPAFGTTITASTIGGTAAAGTSTSVAREDHKHAFPSGAAPSALTVSSTQATGTSASPALADHVHAMPGSATAGASAVGDTAATGTASTVALSDHRHSREAFGTPGAVTGGATAASGSATTLARSDHVHSTASMPVLLASTTLGSDAASYTFSSISGTYTNLGIRFYLRTSYAGPYDYIGIRYNGDTAANYSWHQSTAQTSIMVGAVNAANNGIANAASYGEVFIPHYSVSTFGHTTGALVYYNGSSTATPSFSSNLSSGSGANTGGYWNSTSVITSVTILSVLGANLKANSRFDLYGYP